MKLFGTIAKCIFVFFSLFTVIAIIAKLTEDKREYILIDDVDKLY